MIKRTACLFLFLLTMTVSALAGEKTDVVVMKNGDRMTCEIKGLRSGILYISVDYIIGTLSLEWEQIVRIESGRTFLLRTESGSVYQGTLKTENPASEGPMTITVVGDANEMMRLEQSHVISMEPTSEQLWKRFSGAVSTDMIYSRGNQTVQYNFSSETEYLQERWSARMDFISNLATSNGDTTSTRDQVRLFGRHLSAQRNYFYAGVLSALQSSEQGIRHQTSVGGGAGRFFRNTNNASISLLGGLALQRTNYDQSVLRAPSQDVISALIAIELKLFRFDRTNFNLITDILPAVSDPGRVYVTSNASYFVKLFGKLSWNVSSYLDFDNRPPGHFSGTDYGTSSGLSLTFGSR